MFSLPNQETECLKNLIANLQTTLQEFQEGISSPDFDARISGMFVTLAALYAEYARQQMPERVPQEVVNLLNKADLAAEQFRITWEKLRLQPDHSAFLAAHPDLKAHRDQILSSVRLILGYFAIL